MRLILPSVKNLFALFLIAVCAVFNSAAAQNISLLAAKSEVTTPQVKAELLAYAPDGVAPGKKVMVGLQITHQPEWHTYWMNSGDSGQPTDLQWTLPAGVTAGAVQWPTPKKIPIGSLINYGYENTLLLPVPLEVSQLFKPGVLNNDLEIKLKAVWLVCKQECIPQEGEFSLKIPIKGSTALSAGAFEAAKSAAPQPVAAIAGKVNTAAIFSDQKDAKAGLTGRMFFTVHGLPAAVQGKKLTLFPETAEVIHNGAAATGNWDQLWEGGVFKANLPLSSQRSASPQTMPLLLVTEDGKQAWRADTTVQGEWPTVAAAAQVSPELAAALKANAASQQAPVNVAGQPLNSSDSSDAMSFLPALLLALIGGMILNLMPCVFPVLAIKVMGFAQHAHDRRVRVAIGVMEEHQQSGWGQKHR